MNDTSSSSRLKAAGLAAFFMYSKGRGMINFAKEILVNE